jgi:hypothetical protein
MSKETMYNISNDDYKMLENTASEFYAIKLLKGKWKDVIFTYGAVSISEDVVNDNATLSFKWNLNDSGNCEPEELTNNEKFQNYIGALLQFIISESLENKEAKIGTANTHTQPSNTQ